MRHGRVAHLQAHGGVAIVETIIVLPIVLVVILGTIQFALIYQAKATLNHAALQAARAGAVEHAHPEAIRRGLARGLVPLYSPPSSLAGFTATFARVYEDVLQNARIRILNPTLEAFADFSEEANGVREIPNDRLHARSTAVGARSGINIQDANLLRLEVTYGYELKVPLVNWFITRTLLTLSRHDEYDAFERELLRRTLLPIVSTSTVRMQTPLRFTELLVSRADILEPERFLAGSAPHPANEHRNQQAVDENEPSEFDDAGRSLADAFFGFGTGGDSSLDIGTDGDHHVGPRDGDDEDWIIGGGGSRDCPINSCCSPSRSLELG